MGCITFLMKYILFIFNLFFIIFGIASITVGAIFQSELDNDLYDGSDVKSFQFAAIFLIVIGCITFVIAFLGCCGAIKKNSCMLMTYGVLLLIILALQIGAIIYAIVFLASADDLKNDVFDLLREQLPKYSSNETAKDYIDDIQTKFECCGVQSPADWNAYLPSYPSSCCKDSPSVCASPYTKGCGQDLFDFLKNEVKILAIIAGVFAAIELVGAVFAFFVAKKSRRSQDD